MGLNQRLIIHKNSLPKNYWMASNGKFEAYRQQSPERRCWLNLSYEQPNYRLRGRAASSLIATVSPPVSQASLESCFNNAVYMFVFLERRVYLKEHRASIGCLKNQNVSHSCITPISQNREVTTLCKETWKVFPCQMKPHLCVTATADHHWVTFHLVLTLTCVHKCALYWLY